MIVWDIIWFTSPFLLPSLVSMLLSFYFCINRADKSGMFTSFNNIDDISCCFNFILSRHCTITSNYVAVICSCFRDLTSSCMSILWSLLSLSTSCWRTNFPNHHTLPILSTVHVSLFDAAVVFAHE